MKKISFVFFMVLLMITFPERAFSIKAEIFSANDFDTEDQRFHFLGVGIINPITKEISILPRLMAGFYRYKFKSDGKTLSADLQTIMPAVGIRYSSEGYSLAVIGGADFRRTERERADGGDETDDEQGGFGQLELDIWPLPMTNFNIILNFSSIDEFFWSRIRVKRDIGRLAGLRESLFAGIEAIGSGNEDFQAWQIGVFNEFSLYGKLYLTGKVGYKRSTEIGDSAYFGFDMYLSF